MKAKVFATVGGPFLWPCRRGGFNVAAASLSWERLAATAPMTLAAKPVRRLPRIGFALLEASVDKYATLWHIAGASLFGIGVLLARATDKSSWRRA